MQLADVKQSFIQWRKIKKYNDSIPDYLWKEVSKIDKKYSVSEIYRALSISHKQYAANLPGMRNIVRDNCNITRDIFHAIVGCITII